jgi:FAD:protein FMN transferase
MTAHRVEHIMGTAISIDVRDGSVDGKALDDVFAWFRHVDDTFSTYKDDSDVSRLGRGEVRLEECEPSVAWVLGQCERLRDETGGYFDCRAGGRLDPSGFVKGWSVEVGSAMLMARGSDNHCINAGGDIRVRGVPEAGRTWHAGIVHPLVPGKLTVVIEGTDIAIATSGTSERGLHVFDPIRRRATDALASVTLVGPDLTVTDAYATAALAMGLDAPEWLATRREHEAYVVDAGGHVWWTEGFPRYAPALMNEPVVCARASDG